MDKIKFDDSFLGVTIGMPKVRSKESFLKKYRTLEFTHFSVLFSLERKMAICTGVNIDGENQYEIKRNRDNWKFYGEPLKESNQVGPSFYKQTGTNFHKGHIVRRLDPCWGEEQVATMAEEETFFYVNACPQHRNFNPRIWLELERSVLEKGAISFEKKLNVFSGPVLHPDDLPYINKVDGEYLFLPFMFWKIVTWKKEDGKVYAIGFVQSQKTLISPHLDYSYKMPRVKSDFDRYIENLKFKDDAVYQTEIENIEKISGLDFDIPNVIKPKIGVPWKEIKANYDHKPTTKYKSENGNEFTLEGVVYG